MSVWVVCTDTKCVTTLIVPATNVLISVHGSMCPAVSYLSCTWSVGKLPTNQYNTKVSLCIYLQNSSPLPGRIGKQQHLERSTSLSWRYNPHNGVVFYSPLAGFSLLAYEVSWSHTTTPYSRYDSSERMVSPSQRPLPNKTQHSQHKHPCPGWDSNPSSRQASGRRPTP